MVLKITNFIINTIEKLVRFINEIGKPKTVNHNTNVEVISAVKVKPNKPKEEPNLWDVNHQKNNRVVSSGTTQNFIDYQKNKFGSYGVTGSIGVSGMAGSYGSSSKAGSNGTAGGRPIKVGGSYFDPHTFQQVFPEDLKDLLTGGDNVTPTDITEMYTNTIKAKTVNSQLKSNKK